MHHTRILCHFEMLKADSELPMVRSEVPWSYCAFQPEGAVHTKPALPGVDGLSERSKHIGLRWLTTDREG